MRRGEILAPVGTPEMMEAAVAAGADAVYLAGKDFGARAYARNFTDQELSTLILQAHARGMKVYLTLNVLIKESEMEAALAAARSYYEMGADALILQDLGLLDRLKGAVPGMELHASTQVSLYDAYGVLGAEELGFDRVVIARETPLKEIANIKDKTDLPLEVFVHGSLCVCVSGQCLISSFAGGRSGNRGRCAQPCRKKHRIRLGDRTFPEDTYLSPSDLASRQEIWKLADLGVESFKIEGRMKKPEYVYETVRYYRQILDEGYAEDNLAEVSNRSFTKGFLFGDFGVNYAERKETVGTPVGTIQQGKKTLLCFNTNCQEGDYLILTTDKGKKLPLTLTEDYRKGQKLPLSGYSDVPSGQPVYRVYRESLRTDREEAYENRPRIPVDFKASFLTGQPASLTAKSGEKTVRVQGDVVDVARKNPLDPQLVRAQLERLGQTEYVLRDLSLHLSDDAFLPKSALNHLRTQAVEALAGVEAKDRSFVYRHRQKRSYQKRKPVFTLETDRFEEGRDYSSYQRVYSESTEALKRFHELGLTTYFLPPRLADEAKREETKQRLEKALPYIDGISCYDLGDVFFFRTYEKPLHIESSIGMMNQDALNFWGEEVTSLSLSQEMTLSEMRELSFPKPVEVLYSGPVVEMLLRHCPASAIRGCVDETRCESCPFGRGFYLEDEFTSRYVKQVSGVRFLYGKRIEAEAFYPQFQEMGIAMLRVVDRQIPDTGISQGHYLKGIE